MKISELRDKSLEELTQLLDEKQLDAFRIRMQQNAFCSQKKEERLLVYLH